MPRQHSTDKVFIPHCQRVDVRQASSACRFSQDKLKFVEDFLEFDGRPALGCCFAATTNQTKLIQQSTLEGGDLLPLWPAPAGRPHSLKKLN
jgi:hypothetical protein